MRGQRLFIRAIEKGDHDQVRLFLAIHGGSREVPACGLLGKLAGDLVAVAAVQMTSDAVEIKDVIVARELRRKRIGRVMLLEIEQMAARDGRSRLIVEGESEAPEFLRRVGFEREGDQWVRTNKLSSASS